MKKVTKAKAEPAMNEWRVSTNYCGGERSYQVYRRIDANATDHSGNRENKGGVFGAKAEAQAYADKLNAGIDPEAEEEAETETVEDTGAPLEPLFGGDLAKHAEHDVADATAGTALSTITLLCDGDARRDTVHNAANDWITIDCAEAWYKEAFRQETA